VAIAPALPAASLAVLAKERSKEMARERSQEVIAAAAPKAVPAIPQPKSVPAPSQPSDMAFEAPPQADPPQRERAAPSSRLARTDDAPSELGDVDRVSQAPSSVPDDESLPGMQDRLANRVELGVTAPILRQQLSLPCAPAYEDDDVVEYYAVKQEQWILARMQVDLQRPSLQNVPSGNIHYNVLIGQVSKQLRQDVPLDVLRPPLGRSEAVEVFSLRGGGSWLPAFIDPVQPGDTNLGYNIRLHPGGQELRRIPATRLRRRFTAKSVVRIYKGPDLGWTRMVVHPLAGSDGSDVRGLRIAEATPHLQNKSTPVEPWALVPVCKETDIILEDESEGSEDEFDPSKIPEPDWIPSYLVRANILEMPLDPGQLSGAPERPQQGRGGLLSCGTDDRRPKGRDTADPASCTPTSPTSPLSPIGFRACAGPEAKTAKAAAKEAAKSALAVCGGETEAPKPKEKKRAPPQRKEGDRGTASTPAAPEETELEV